MVTMLNRANCRALETSAKHKKVPDFATFLYAPSPVLTDTWSVSFAPLALWFTHRGRAGLVGDSCLSVFLAVGGGAVGARLPPACKGAPAPVVGD